MIKKFFSYAFAEGLSKGLNWAMIAALPLILSPEQYGTVGLLVAIEGTLSTLLLAGQERAILRFNHEKEKNVLSYSIQLVLLFLIVALIVVSFVGLFSKSVAGLPLLPSFFFLMVSIGLYNLARLIMTYSRVIDNLKLFWGTRFFYQITKIIAVFILCYFVKNANGYIYGALLSAAIFILVYFNYFSTKFSLRQLFLFDEHFRFFLIFGTPLIFQALSGSVLSYADRFFVQGFLDQRELGIYTFTYSLGSSLVFFYGITLISFEPLVYKHAKEKKNFRSMLDFYSRIIPASAFILALLIILFFKLYVTHLLDPVYLQGYSILPVLLSAHLFLPIYNIGNIEFIIVNQPKFIAYTTIFSACINLLFNFLLISSMGIAGAALSTLITYFFLAAGINFLLIKKKIFKMRTYQYSYLQTIFFCAVIFMFAYEENVFVRILIIIFAFVYLAVSFIKGKNILKS